MGVHQAAVAHGKQSPLSQHRQAGFRQNPAAVRLHRQAGGCQPGGRLTAGAGQIGRALVGAIAFEGYACRRQQPLAGPVGGGAAQGQAGAPQQQAAGVAAPAEGQGQLDGAGATAPQAQGGRRRQGVHPGQKGLQRLDRHGPIRRRWRDRSHIQAEDVETQTLSPQQQQLARPQFKARDFSLQKAHAGLLAEPFEVDAGRCRGRQAGHHRWHQAGIQAGGVAAHQGDRSAGGPALGPQGPLAQHQHMAMTTARQQQLGLAGGGVQGWRPSRCWSMVTTMPMNRPIPIMPLAS